MSLKASLSEPLWKRAGGVWAFVPTSGGGRRPGGRRPMTGMMTRTLTSPPRVFPYLSFSQPRCLSLIGAPWPRDLMLHFSLSRRQLRLCRVSLLDRRSF